MSTIIAYNDANFKALFPEYGNYAEAALSQYWTFATGYISDQNGGCYVGGMSLAQQTQALNLMTAHLVYLAGLISKGGLQATGQVPGVVTGATIDKISVTLQPPPEVNQWQWWLNQTPYGQQLLALLQVVAVGGFYGSGAPPGRAGFRFSGVP